MFPIEKRILGGHGGRDGHKPIIIVNHVTVGGKQSVINTFSNLANGVSSTFMNCRDGSIVQFCEMTTRPKTNGNIRSPKAPIVIQMGNVNPNYYSITIENEDAYNDDTPGVDGQLTEKQFISLCWLHKYIQTEVKRIYGHTIPLNSSHVFGHRDIDSKGKALCPGNNFPFDRLYKELAVADTMTLEAYEEHLNYKQSDTAISTEVYAFFTRFEDLERRKDGDKYANEVRRKIMLMAPIMADMGLKEEPTVESILKRIKEVKSTAIVSGTWQKEGLRKASIGAKYAQEKSIL